MDAPHRMRGCLKKALCSLPILQKAFLNTIWREWKQYGIIGNDKGRIRNGFSAE